MPEKIKASIPIDIDEIGGLLYLEPRMIDVRFDLKYIPVEPKITLVEQSKLIDISNIPMLEYSNMFIEDRNSPVNTYAKAILGNYDNRSIVQNQLVEDEISNSDGSVESAVLWLKVINSNLNQLMGLSGVTNYLLGMMGITGRSVDYVSKGQLDEMKNDFNQLVNDKTKADPVDVFLTALGTASLVGGMAKPLAKVGIKFTPLPLQIAVASAYYLYKYRPETPPNGKTLPNYLTGEVVYSTNEPKGSYMSGAPLSEYPNYLENKEAELSKEKAETNDLLSIFRQEPKGMLKEVLNGYTDEELEAIILKNKDVTIRAKQPRSKRSGSKYKEPEKFYEKLFSIYKVEAAELPPEMKKQYAKNQPNNPYENKTSTNASISEDLTNSTFSENKYGPQQIEYIITVPVEINTTVNEAEKFDMDQILRTIGPEVENKIRGFISTQGLRGALDR